VLTTLLTTTISDEMLLGLTQMPTRSTLNQCVLWVVFCLLAMYSVLDGADQPPIVPAGASFVALGDPEDDARDDVAAVMGSEAIVIPSRSCTNVSEPFSIQVPARRNMSGLTRGPPHNASVYGHGRFLAFSAFSAAGKSDVAPQRPLYPPVDLSRLASSHAYCTDFDRRWRSIRAIDYSYGHRIVDVRQTTARQSANQGG